MSSETFFSYKRYRWMWFNFILLVVAGLIYRLDNPVGGRSGGSLLGLIYGGLAAAGILYLMWYGIRKRSYSAQKTTLKGCLSAHVWIGLGLLLLVPLHSAFQFGINVHTLLYLVMCIVIFSGFWGALNYVDLAADIKSHRGGGTIKKFLEQVHYVSQDIQDLGKQKSDQFIRLIQKLDFNFKPSIAGSLLSLRVAAIGTKEMSELLAGLPEKEQGEGLKLIGLVNKKRELVTSLQNESAVLIKLKIWLFLHLPLSFALLVLLFVHIFSVLYFH